jgi:DNA-binding Lrp family transcriptional regulator
MTQDEIIEMAKQCGIVVGYPKYQDINAFAKLVAEKEREACAVICDELHKARVGKDNYFAFAANAIRELRAKQ